MLKDYFTETDRNSVLNDCEKSTIFGDELSDAQKCKCVNIIAEYAVNMFGFEIQTHQIKQLAHAAVSLIRGLKSKSGEPIVI